MGVLKWVDWTVSEPRYFQLQTDHTPVHLALLDEVGAAGPCTAHAEPPLNAVRRLCHFEADAVEQNPFPTGRLV